MKDTYVLEYNQFESHDIYLFAHYNKFSLSDMFGIWSDMDLTSSWLCFCSYSIFVVILSLQENCACLSPRRVMFVSSPVIFYVCTQNSDFLAAVSWIRSYSWRCLEFLMMIHCSWIFSHSSVFKIVLRLKLLDFVGIYITTVYMKKPLWNGIVYITIAALVRKFHSCA